MEKKELKQIIFTLGLQVAYVQNLSGGDINDAYCLHGNEKKYFLKINNAKRYPGMFEKEANGLNVLEKGCDLFIPKVVQYGETNGQQYLILDWLEKRTPGEKFWEHFGAALAEMHKIPQAYFGFEEDNYIASLPQKNTPHEYWSGFYAECRMIPLTRHLKDSGYFSAQDIDSVEAFCKRLDEIFPRENPSLLHGDLWSGNYMMVEGGNASIFDPAVYFGHREIDLGMTLLFGGFSSPFYETYHNTYPLEKNWRQRVQYTQLYPLLVHAILFGGRYIQSVREILRKFK